MFISDYWGTFNGLVEKRQGREKKTIFKLHVSSYLNKKHKKPLKKVLYNGLNVLLLHPQQRIGSYLNIENRIKNKAKVLEKRFGRNKRSNYICAPLKWGQVLRQIEQVEELRDQHFTWKVRKIYFQKTFQKRLWD